MDIAELARVYEKDCGAECGNCPLNQRIERIMADFLFELPKELTICACFDLINLNHSLR